MEPARRNAPIWLKVWLVFHVIAITIWSLPKSAPGVLSGAVAPKGTDWILYVNDVYGRTSPIQQYVLGMGLFQSWDMFAPNPTNRDVWGDALVTYKDGSTKIYQYPRINTENYFWKYVKERYRKYYERANMDSFSYLWPDFARRIAVNSYDDPNNPPTRVQLRRHYVFVPRIITFPDYCESLYVKRGHLTFDDWSPPTPPPAPFTESPYYTVDVDQDRLKRDAGQ